MRPIIWDYRKGLSEVSGVMPKNVVRTLKIGTDDPGVNLLPFNHFAGKERIAIAVLVAKDHIVPIGQFLRIEIVDQLLLALLKVGAIGKAFGFDDIFLRLIEDQNIGAPATAWNLN